MPPLPILFILHQLYFEQLVFKLYCIVDVFFLCINVSKTLSLKISENSCLKWLEVNNSIIWDVYSCSMKCNISLHVWTKLIEFLLCSSIFWYKLAIFWLCIYTMSCTKFGLSLSMPYVIINNTKWLYIYIYGTLVNSYVYL